MSVSKYDQFENVTFHPACKPDRIRLNQSFTVEDEDLEKNIEEKEEDWILTWHGVRITEKDVACNIIKQESLNRSYVTVNPKYFELVAKWTVTKENWWVRIKKWVLALFRFRQ